jgi:hypothetical protein
LCDLDRELDARKAAASPGGPLPFAEGSKCQRRLPVRQSKPTETEAIGKGSAKKAS